MKSALLVAVLVLACAPKTRAGTLESISLWFRADVTITPDGHATDVSWRNYTEMPAVALADLERRIADWEFRPGEIDGEPVATGTTLVIHVVAVERPDGRFGMEVANVIPGPSPIDTRMGLSPYRDIVTSGSLKNANVVLDATFEPGRDPVVDIIEMDATSGNRRFQSALERDSLWIAEHWTIRHETLAGVPVPARMRFNNRFCWGGDWCERNVPDAMMDLPEMRNGQPIPLDSAVEFLSDLEPVAAQPDKTSVPGG